MLSQLNQRSSLFPLLTMAGKRLEAFSIICDLKENEAGGSDEPDPAEAKRAFSSGEKPNQPLTNRLQRGGGGRRVCPHGGNPPGPCRRALKPNRLFLRSERTSAALRLSLFMFCAATRSLASISKERSCRRLCVLSNYTQALGTADTRCHRALLPEHNFTFNYSHFTCLNACVPSWRPSHTTNTAFRIIFHSKLFFAGL